MIVEVQQVEIGKCDVDEVSALLAVCLEQTGRE